MLDFGYYNMDCMEGMKEFPDKYFDLAIVDPPYGGGGTQSDKAGLIGGGADYEHRNRSRFGGLFDRYHIGTADGRKMGEEVSSKRDIRHWDVAPGEEYFTELARVSKNQIIWGANYFDMPPTRCFIVWRKTNIPAKGFSMAPVEYAWTSFNANAEYVEFGSAGGTGRGGDRIHPTQKPVDLYIALLNAHAKPGFKILDTHVGSASSLIACHRMGFQYVGFELDPTYYDLSSKRLQEEMSQIRFEI